jgi:hypothetical protein
MPFSLFFADTSPPFRCQMLNITPPLMIRHYFFAFHFDERFIIDTPTLFSPLRCFRHIFFDADYAIIY